MWSPTHIQVTVQRAKGLLIKGKNNTNNCYVTIALAKEKYQTSVKEKASANVEWHEECELTIPERGNRAELVLTCYHRNNLQIDEFLGQVTLPLNEMDVYERPRQKAFKLHAKPGKEKKDKQRGELEVRISFTVQPDIKGSLVDLSKKEKKGSTLGLGGSLLSLGTLEKRKGLKNFAKSMGSKLQISSKKKDKNKDLDAGSITGSISSIGTPGSEAFAPRRFGQTAGDADPGVISEDDDEFVFDNLSHKSSGSSLNVKTNQQQEQQQQQQQQEQTVPTTTPPVVPSPLSSTSSVAEQEIKMRSKTLPPSKPPRIASDPPHDEWEAKLYGKHLEIGSSDSLKRRSWESSRVPLVTQEESDEAKPQQQPHALASTAPTTPNLEDQKRTENIEKPRPLPRSATLESIEEKETKEAEKQIEKKEKSEKRFSKLKYFGKKDKAESIEDLKSKLSAQKQFGERIIIGHENDKQRHGDVKVSAELAKKFDGKTREEIMLIANDLENEVKMQKNKMKEMEDYLDNLLLRVMETHPKILQNPYRNQLSAKSG